MLRPVPMSRTIRLSNFFITMLLCIGLAACGSGGGGGSTVGATATPAAETGTIPGATTASVNLAQSAVVNVIADKQQTVAGGGSVLLSALKAAGTGTAEWMLEPGSPGSLDRTSGDKVRYIPPAAGTINVNTVVNVIVNIGKVTNRISILLIANQSTGEGTDGAGPTTPPVATGGGPGLFLVAGNDFGPGLANGAGTKARFNEPNGIARDARGNLYIADRFNHTIRKISPDSTVTAFAGLAGVAGSADGTGMAARFNAPYGIAVDAAGNLYVADSGNATVRKISPAGAVTTLAGMAGTAGAVDGAGSAARFGGGPMSIAVDTKGNLFVTESTHIRKVTPAGEVSTFAGILSASNAMDGPIASATFNGLRGITIDGAGNLYVVDADSVRQGSLPPGFTFAVSASIRKISTDGMVSTLAGKPGVGNINDVTGSADGTGTNARFKFPEGITIDPAGNLYVGDQGNQTVRKITPAGVVSTVAGMAGQTGSADGSGASARFLSPSGVIADGAGIIYVTDKFNHTVRRISSTGAVTTLAGAAPKPGSADGTKSSALFNSPQGITKDGAGNLYVADTGNSTIRKITPAGVVSTLAGAAGQMGSMDGIGPQARFNSPLGITADLTVNLFVADLGNQTIRKITPSGAVTTLAGSPNSVFADGTGAAAGFREPQAITIDAAGNLYVVDRVGSSIRKITPAGVVTTLAGMNEADGFADGAGPAARFDFPQDIAADGAGNLYVIDNGAVIRKITPAGVVTTLAGASFPRGTADGAGTAARFFAPRGITADTDGTLYVADYNSIRKITPQGVVTTVAGTTAENQGNAVGANLFLPERLVLLEPKRLEITSGNGVFELRLP